MTKGKPLAQLIAEIKANMSEKEKKELEETRKQFRAEVEKSVDNKI